MSVPMDGGGQQQSRAVLWDLDGTLADTEEYHWQSWQRVMSDEGLAVTHEQFLETFGQRNDTILSGWLGKDADPSRIERIGEAKEVALRTLIRERGLEPLPGAVEWVKRLSGEGWRQAITTSAPRANVDVMLDALGISSLFDAIVSSEDVTEGKPNPQIFLTAAARLQASPSRCIVVEDAPAGIEGASRAGMSSIGVRAKGEPLSATLFMRSLAELEEDVFEQLLGC